MSTLELNFSATSDVTQTIPDAVDFENVPGSSNSSSSSCSNSNRRSLRTRNADNYLHKINRRVIKKPKKHFLGFNNSEEEIQKFYLNNKANKVKSTFLETIYEEQEGDQIEMDNDDGISQNCTLTKNVGIKKLKRSLSCSDGTNVSKAIVQKRKRKIKDLLGNQKKPPKFSMDFFMEKMQAMQNIESNKSSELNESKSDSECPN